MTFPTRRACAAAAAGLIAFSGCGTIDADKAESEIEKGIINQTGAQQVSVSCPDDVELKKGDTFKCVGKVDGQDVPINVEQRDDEGNIRWEATAP